ncbi:hypothetical protein ABVK25_009451 [Lepraria finkii]|uniref:Uncharacterized protein n=1 Tax=Lepraria finkii TaxID=1340010 RepID=A0ABR4AYX4_9LECA
MTDNTIAHFEMSDSTANVHDLPCTVCAEEERKLIQENGRPPSSCFIQLIGLMATAPFLMTISFSWGEVYGADLTCGQPRCGQPRCDVGRHSELGGRGRKY